MPDRSIRVSEDVWRRANAAAALRGESLKDFTDAALDARLRGVVQVTEQTLETGSRVVEAVEWPAESVPDLALPPTPELF